jgi:hypothetical protein
VHGRFWIREMDITDQHINVSLEVSRKTDNGNNEDALDDDW